jgi:hypothetical protein
MKRYLLAAFAAVFFFSGLTGFPAVVTVTAAFAQGADVQDRDGLRLPRGHRYELYNPENAGYGAVNVESVPSYVNQGRWIYDRTAGEWVSHPSVGTPNPQYAVHGYGRENSARENQGRENHRRDFRREDLLGQQEVDFTRDSDVIDVGKGEGRFQKIRVVVRGGPIQLYDMKVIFTDDSVFDPENRDRILQEDSSYVIDLPGHQRIIKRITFLYRSIDRREGKATVLVYGEN